MSISDFFMKYIYVGLYNRLQPQYPDGTKANFYHFVKYLEQQGREHVADNKCSIVFEEPYSFQGGIYDAYDTPNFFHFFKCLKQQGREHVADSKYSIVVEEPYSLNGDVHDAYETPEFKWNRAIENLKIAELVRNTANKKYVIPFEDEVAVLQKISLADTPHEERHIEEIASDNLPQLLPEFEEDQYSDDLTPSEDDANMQAAESVVEGIISALPEALIGL